MNFYFPATGVRTVDLSACPAGELVLLGSPHQRDAILGVVVGDPQNDNGLQSFVALQGKTAFNVNGPIVPDQWFGLVLPVDHLELELEQGVRTIGQSQERGVLLVTQTGASIVVMGKDSYGSDQPRYLSLVDWSLQDWVGENCSTFGRWRLVTKPPSGSGRAMITGLVEEPKG